MKVSEINNSISTLPGVGPAKAALFANLNIFTIGDLLQFYPRDYEDRTQRVTIAQSVQTHEKVHTIAQVIAHEWFGFGKMRTLKLIITEGTGSAELIAFNRAFLEKSHPIGSICAVTGRFEVKYGKYQCTQFDLEKITDSGKLADFSASPIPNSKVFPIYHLTEGLTGKIISKTVASALNQFSIGIEDELPEELIKKYQLLSKKDSIKKIHQPQTLTDAAKARNTLVYEELFLFQKVIAERALAHRGELPDLSKSGIKNQKEISDDEFNGSLSPRQKQFLGRLPFSPTQDQKSVITLLNYDIDKNYDTSQAKNSKTFSMRALLQGDVGSGKTLVSFFAALRIIDYGSQCAIMAPTELLARQHAENAAKQLESVGVRVAYLTGNLKTKGRNNLLAALKNGEIDLVIGTHALFSKNVQYHDLALAIIDEQHRFGVMQRSAILEKGRQSVDSIIREPNLLMMSATPIPQTLALTVFGDLDVFTIHTMPQGRKPVTTYLVRAGNEHNAYEAVRKELQNGHQAYFVYPAIENNLESEDDGTQKSALKSAEEMYDFLSKNVYPEFKTALIHGKVDEDEQNRILEDFRLNKIQILVATTVVEVGVDVPNATCIVIEQADRFGLAALHQLRGRVGRGADQSYCFLIYRKDITENGIARMKALHETTDGFKIAEEDLKLRGPGEITGTAQSGELTFKIADPVRDEKIMQLARIDAFAAIKQTN
ncbi:ATP-dependent DNA helicase RecG [Treponema zioleckii]|uniref:ATP-dependent DNA helicase RecG n=1 Tax=Treponema zioleckii TaxID=331680 RepID=UPI00168A6320|nr:ATP-dependent DNA helicase RecG [Treponema zioleckii]